MHFFSPFSKIDIESQREKERMEAVSTLAIYALYKSEKKRGVAMITIKDVKGIFNQLRKILAILDKIYHAMGLDEEEK